MVDSATLNVVAIGAHADREVQRALASGPVAVLPAGSAWPEDPRHVGVAFDGTPAAEAALLRAFELAARHRAALTLYWVLPHPADDGAPGADDADRELRDRAYALLDAAADRAPEGVNPERRVLYGGDAAQTIASEADGVIDVLVTGSRGLTGWRRALLGSFTRGLLEIVRFPLLVVPAPASDTGATAARGRTT